MSMDPAPAPVRRVRLPSIELQVAELGQGPPVLLLHGYPQTHRIWRRCAALLADRWRLIMPDLRGYGGSAKPDAGPEGAEYSKRRMAADLVELLDALGIARCPVVGHDRGGRVAHRLALDHPDRVAALAVLDILPTRWHAEHPDTDFARTYWHWGFLAAGDEPLRLIGQDPHGFLRRRLAAWSATPGCFDPGDVHAYEQAFADPRCIAATCADYRAAAGIDLDHDRADADRTLAMPVTVLWGRQGFVGRTYRPLEAWASYAADLRGGDLPGGHFPAEECPDATAAAIAAFLSALPTGSG